MSKKTNEEYITEIVPISKIKNNPNNPRVIRDEKFNKLVASLKEFPEMINARPIVVNTDMIVLGGNMRLKAARAAGWNEIAIIRVDWTDEQQRQFIIKDNVAGGEWDWEMLANQWDETEIINWGVDPIGFKLNTDDETDDFTLPDGDKLPFQTMSFTFSDAQAECIKNAIAAMKQTDEYKYADTSENENSNGNALFLIVEQWDAQRK